MAGDERCGFCGTRLAVAKHWYVGRETVACVLCVSSFLDSLRTKPPAPTEPVRSEKEPPAVRVARLESHLASSPDDTDAMLELAGVLATSGRKEEAAKLSVRAFECFSKRSDLVGAYAALRQAVEQAPHYADIKERFERFEQTMGDGQEAQLARLLGSLARTGGVFRGTTIVNAEEEETDPLRRKLGDLARAVPRNEAAEQLGHQCRFPRPPGISEVENAEIAALFGKFPGLHCHLCGEDRPDRKLFAVHESERVACAECIELAAERIAAGTAS